jgi:hypothetical protein
MSTCSEIVAELGVNVYINFDYFSGSYEFLNRQCKYIFTAFFERSNDILEVIQFQIANKKCQFISGLKRQNNVTGCSFKGVYRKILNWLGLFYRLYT